MDNVISLKGPISLDLRLPGNPRYAPKELLNIFGYDYLFRPVAEVEIATMKVLAEIGIMPPTDAALLTPEVEMALLSITTTEVDKVEREVTSHDIRAWVHLAKKNTPNGLHRWIHIPLTSYDAIDTARAILFKRAHVVVRAKVEELISHLVERVRGLSQTIQIGRTHGQHAVPITVGFWLATVLNRLVENIKAANVAEQGLVGKISGPVGAYNAQVALGITDACSRARWNVKGESFETLVLKKLGLKPGNASTQIVAPEPMTDYLYSCLKLSATLGQFGRDCRHLMRSEIDEIVEPFESTQVGSSTMAHKRNPMNFENLEGMWQRNVSEFGKVLSTLISEHQRDLVGSSLQRDFPIIVVNLVQQLNTLLRRKGDGQPFILRMNVNQNACEKNLRMQGQNILAEFVYLSLQVAGYEGDAHELVNRKVLPKDDATEGGISLQDRTSRILRNENADFSDRWLTFLRDLPVSRAMMLTIPQRYVGLAAEKAREIADLAESYLKGFEN